LNRLKLTFFLGTLLVLSLFLGGIGYYVAPVLEVWGENPPNLLRLYKLFPRKAFCLEYINSIYGARVREVFSYIPGKGLYLVEVESSSPAVFEYYGLDGGRGGKKRLCRPMRPFTLRSMDYSHHRLIIHGKAISLQGLVKPGETLQIKIRVPILTYG
jgi:hypothetical protein